MAEDKKEIVKMGITENGVNWLADQMESKKEKGLCFPENYSIRNAMTQAFLMLNEAEDKDGRPLLQVCTQASVVQALSQMAVTGLNPAKKQCYFVAYGKKCQLLPSYFGTLTILNRVRNLKRQPVANVVRQGDVFEYGYDPNTMDMKIFKHETKIENMDNPIIAAYAVITTETEVVTEVMSRAQLEKAWGQGQSWKSAVKKGYESATHKNFPEEMAKKSVLNRAAKRLINATDDSSIMSDEGYQAFNEADESSKIEVVAETVAREVEEKANSAPFQAPPVPEERMAVPVQKVVEKQTVAEPAVDHSAVAETEEDPFA